MSAIRFALGGTGDDLWAITNMGVVKYTGLPRSLSPALSVPLSLIPAPSALGVDPTSGSVLITSDTTQQVFVINGSSGALIRTYGSLGGYTAESGPTVSASKLSFFGNPYVAVDGRGDVWVSDQGNRRTLHIDSMTGDLINDISFISASYASTCAFGAPDRVFSNFLEFQVNYSVPLGSSGSWALVRNWAAGVDPMFLKRGIEWSGPTSVAVVLNRTFGVVAVSPPNNEFQQAIVEFIMPSESCPGGLQVLRYAGHNTALGYLPVGQMDRNGDFHFVVTGSEGPEGNTSAYFAVFAASVIIDSVTGAANYSCNVFNNTMIGCKELARVPMPNPSTSLAPRSSMGAVTTPLTSEGLLIIFDASTSRNGGFHLGALNTSTSTWVWQASPWGAWLYDATWQVLQPGNVNTSIGYLRPETLDGRYGANDATINYAGNQVLADPDGDSVIFGFHGEFWMDAEANQFLHFHGPTGLFIGQFGVPNKRETNYSYPVYLIPGQAGNSFSPAIARANDADGQSALFLYHNDENQHAGVHRWRISGVDEMQLLTAVNT